MKLLHFLDLFLFLILPNCLCADTFYFSSSGVSGNDCKDSSAPCPLISEVLTIEINGRRTLVLLGSYILNESLILSGTTFVVKSNDSQVDVISFDDSNIASTESLFIIIATTTFSNLTFDLSISSVAKDSVFFIDQHKAFFEEVTFNSSDESDVNNISGLILCNGGELSITKCIFKLINSTGEYSIIHCVDTHLTLLNSSFINCSRVGNTKIYPDESIPETEGTGNAGGCIYHQTTVNGINIKIGIPDRETRFENCSAECGGAMYFSFLRNPGSILVTNVTLTNNKAKEEKVIVDGVITTTYYGNNIFVDKVTTYLINIENFPFFAGRTEDDIESMGDKDGHIVKLITYANQYKDNLYVGNAGVSNPNCNSSEKLCKYLADVEEYLNYARNIYIVDNYTMIRSWEVNSAELTLQGSDNNASLYADAACSFDIYALKITTLKMFFTENFCNSGLSYFLYVERDGSLIVSSCSFTISKPGIKISNVIISLSESSLTLDSCTFFDIDSDGSSGSIANGDGKVVFIYGCMFEDCSCENGDGGVLNVEFSENLIFGRNEYVTSFKRNKATRGGAIFLHPEGCDYYFLVHLTFGKGEDQNSATNGKNLYVVSATLMETCNLAHFQALSTEVSGDNYFEGVVDDGDDSIDLIDLLKGKYKEGPSMVYFSDPDDCNITDVDGINKTCGSDPGGRLTRIGYETTRVKYACVNVTIMESWTLTLNYLWKGNGYTVYGNTHNSKIVINHFKFTIETNTECRNLTMILASSIDGDVFTISFGKFILYFVTVCPADRVLSTINGSLFLLETYVNSQFESVYLYNITTSEYGNVIKATVGGGKHMLMTGVDYKNCKTKGEYGGALYIDVKDEGYFYFIKSGSCISTVTGCASASKGGAIYMILHKSPLSITFTDIEFGIEKDDLNIAPNGGSNLYIVADQLEEVLMKSSFTISSDYGLMKRIVFEDLESELTYSLADVFPDYSTNMYLSGEIEASKTFCGSFSSPCVNLNRAFRKASGSRKELCIIANITHNEQLSCSKECTLVGLNNTSGIICERGSKFMVIKDINISLLIFSLKSIEGTLMTVSKCTYTATSLTFIAAEGLESIILNSPLLSISNKGRGVISSCIFKDITAINSDGSAINTYLSTSTSLYLKGCSFIYCKVINGNGGALFVNVSNDASVIIQGDGETPCIFKKCSATKSNNNDEEFSLLKNEKQVKSDAFVVETGRGGAFFLRFGVLPNYVLVENVIFGEGDESNSGDGRDFFVESVIIEDVMTVTRFPILSYFPEDYDGGKAMSVGSDVSLNARSFVKVEKESHLMMIIIISVVAVVVIVIVIILVIICLKRRKRYSY